MSLLNTLRLFDTNKTQAFSPSRSDSGHSDLIRALNDRLGSLKCEFYIDHEGWLFAHLDMFRPTNVLYPLKPIPLDPVSTKQIPEGPENTMNSDTAAINITFQKNYDVIELGEGIPPMYKYRKSSKKNHSSSNRINTSFSIPSIMFQDTFLELTQQFYFLNETFRPVTKPTDLDFMLSANIVYSSLKISIPSDPISKTHDLTPLIDPEISVLFEGESRTMPLIALNYWSKTCLLPVSGSVSLRYLLLLPEECPSMTYFSHLVRDIRSVYLNSNLGIMEAFFDEGIVPGSTKPPVLNVENLTSYQISLLDKLTEICDLYVDSAEEDQSNLMPICILVPSEPRDPIGLVRFLSAVRKIMSATHHVFFQLLPSFVPSCSYLVLLNSLAFTIYRSSNELRWNPLFRLQHRLNHQTIYLAYKYIELNRVPTELDDGSIDGPCRVLFASSLDSQGVSSKSVLKILPKSISTSEVIDLMFHELIYPIIEHWMTIVDDFSFQVVVTDLGINMDDAVCEQWKSVEIPFRFSSSIESVIVTCLGEVVPAVFPDFEQSGFVVSEGIKDRIVEAGRQIRVLVSSNVFMPQIRAGDDLLLPDASFRLDLVGISPGDSSLDSTSLIGRIVQDLYGLSFLDLDVACKSVRFPLHFSRVWRVESGIAEMMVKMPYTEVK